MKKRIAFLLFIGFLLFAISGCIDNKTVISVNIDGSGQIIETINMSKEMIESMSGMMAMNLGAEENASFSVFEEDDFREKAKEFGEGVKLENFKIYEKDNIQYAKGVYSFEDINNIHLQQAGEDLADWPDGDEAGVEIEKELKYITFNFTKDGSSQAILKINRPENKKDTYTAKEETLEPTAVPSSAEIDMMRNMFKGLHLATEIQVNGKITDTNASYVSDSTVTLFDINFDKIIDNDEILIQLQKAKGLYDTQEALKGVEGLKFEPHQEITIVFTPEQSPGLTILALTDKPEYSMESPLFGSKDFHKDFIKGFIALGAGLILIFLISFFIVVIVTIWLFSKIFRKAGYPAALGILMPLPFINLIMLMILAFLDWPIYEKLSSLNEEDSEPNDIPEREPDEEPKVKLNEPLKLKEEYEDKPDEEILTLPHEDEPNEQVLPLPHEDEARDEIDKVKDKDEDEPEIILDFGKINYDSDDEEEKEEGEDEKPESN